MPSRRLAVLPLVAALLLVGCASSAETPGSASPEPSTTPSPSATPSATPTPAAEPAAQPTFDPSPFGPSTTMTDEDVQVLLPSNADVPAGWVSQFVDYGLASSPEPAPCGPDFWYVTGFPLETEAAFASIRWASSGDVPAPPFPTGITTSIWATPDAPGAFERIATDLATCTSADIDDPQSLPTTFEAPAGHGAACGGLETTREGTTVTSRTVFCWASAGELLVQVLYWQTFEPQVVLSDAEIRTAFDAALARALG